MEEEVRGGWRIFHNWRAS